MTHQVTARRYYIRTSCLSSPTSVLLVIIIELSDYVPRSSITTWSLFTCLVLSQPIFAKFHRNTACQFKMLFNVTLKEGGSVEELEKAKERAKNEGGVIRHVYKIIKGFTVEYPDDHVTVLKSNKDLHVEQDGPVRTQSD